MYFQMKNYQMNGIKEALGGEPKQNVIERTYADVTQQKKLIKEVVEETSKSALQSSIQLIDANLTEQKKRVRNVVISGVDEDYGAEGSSLKDVAVDLLGSDCSIRDIVVVKRLGEKKPRKRRPILAVFKSEEVAQHFHNYGRGRKVMELVGCWVNPDLTRTEREAMFKKREERRERLRTRPSVRSRSHSGSGGDMVTEPVADDQPQTPVQPPLAQPLPDQPQPPVQAPVAQSVPVQPQTVTDAPELPSN